MKVKNDYKALYILRFRQMYVRDTVCLRVVCQPWEYKSMKKILSKQRFGGSSVIRPEDDVAFFENKK